MEEPSYPPDEFYQWVGKCIKEWAVIEALLYEVYALALKADPKHLAIIYYRTPSVDARLSFVDELVLTTLPQRERGGRKHPDVIEWMRLVKDIRALLKIRNLLAHAPVGRASITEWIEDDEGKERTFTNYMLHVTTARNEQLRGRQVESIDQPNLPDHFTDLRVIETRIGQIMDKLRPRRVKKVRPAKSSRRNIPRR